jgi:hypothetical protein
MYTCLDLSDPKCCHAVRVCKKGPYTASRHKAEVASTDRDSDRRRPLESKFNVSTFGPILGADLPGRAYMTTDITLKSHEEQRRLLSVDSAMSPARAA